MFILLLLLVNEFEGVGFGINILVGVDIIFVFGIRGGIRDFIIDFVGVVEFFLLKVFIYLYIKNIC